MTSPAARITAIKIASFSNHPFLHQEAQNACLKILRYMQRLKEMKAHLEESLLQAKRHAKWTYSICLNPQCACDQGYSKMGHLCRSVCNYAEELLKTEVVLPDQFAKQLKKLTHLLAHETEDALMTLTHVRELHDYFLTRSSQSLASDFVRSWGEFRKTYHISPRFLSSVIPEEEPIQDRYPHLLELTPRPSQRNLFSSCAEDFG